MKRKESEKGMLSVEIVQSCKVWLLNDLLLKPKQTVEFIKKLQKLPEKNILMIEVEYYCNNCNSYFEADSRGFGYPTCPYCGSDNVSDF